jgi:ketosteroid isomerase-like protein
MPISDADVQTVRRFYAARDLAAMESCFAPEAVWHFPGKSAVAGDHRGWPAIRDAISDFQATIGPLSGGTFRGELLDLAVGEHYIVAVQHGSAQHEGRNFDVTACQLMKVEAGQILEVWGHYSDQYGLDSFWPGHL